VGTVFSTDSLDPKDRFNYWNDVVTRYYAPCEGHSDASAQFNATTTVHSLGSTELSSVTSESVRYDRRTSDLKLIPREDIFISVMLEGEGFFAQNDRQLFHKAGDVLIYDSGKPYSFNYTTAYKAMLLRLPRPLVQVKVSKIDDLGGTVLDGNSAYARLICSLLNEVSIVASSPELIQETDFIVPTIEMLTTAIHRGTEGSLISNITTSQSRLLSEIKAYIRVHITDEVLTLEQIASNKNISLRTLSRLFAESGETPRSWLQNQRICSAYDALVNKKVGNVTEAALTFGFKDISHFSRSFKNTYGYSPKELIR
jgi:AraC family transcriptional regulator, positive regulator of tynA and feaB